MKTNGEIVWKSSNFVKEFANGYRNILNDIIKELKIQIEKGEKVEETSICERMKIGNKTYKITVELHKNKRQRT